MTTSASSPHTGTERPARKPRTQAVLSVLRSEELAPHLVRVVLGGAGFGDVNDNEFTDKYVKILFADPALDLTPPYDLAALRDELPPEQVPVSRTYTVRELDREAQEITIDFVVHGDEGVAGPLHLAIGQEAVAVGACHDLRLTDMITSTHRGHHHCLAKGARPDRMMAELLGRRTGYSHGRGGSMHVAIPEIGLIGTNGIVGGGIPIATGVAYGIQVRKRDDVVICFFGEGASAEGVFHEALNVASLWKLPIVFLCENNQYVELAAQDLHVAGEIWKRGAGYDVPGVHVDGNDIDAVAAAIELAVTRARAGEGPTLIEALTFRWFGHYAGDKAAFRTEAEVAAGRASDPVARARRSLDGSEADAVDAEVEREIAAALEFALASPVSGPEVLSLDHEATTA